MRAISIILIGCLPIFCGCSALISLQGLDVESLASRDQVHRELGSPKKLETVNNSIVEHFQTRRKLSEPHRGVALLFGTSCGVFETWSFPYELYLLSRRTILGQAIHVSYDPDGKVNRLIVEDNGDFLYQGGREIKYPAEIENDNSTPD